MTNDERISVTSGASVCEKCGAPLPEGEWARTCPRCLIAAFAEEEKEGVEFVPGFVVQEEIAHGGMGIVYRAVQRETGRIVALKMILPHLLDSPQVRARFHAEVESVAKLDHPNVLPIYEAGENRGIPYLVMKFVSGGSLAERGAEFLGKPRACVRLVASAARGVQHAHERGILHRDLKPANVLLGEHGEPLVSDFGLAKCLDTTSELTRTLTVFGTPGYIAPEQAKGNASPAADVYSLGAILFDLLTGRPPFLGDNALAVIQQASEKPAPKLRTLSHNGGIDRDLEVICAKCLEREPETRYRSAGNLADDLERWLEGRPIAARPVLVPVRAVRWARRNPTVAAMTVLLLALGVAMGMMAWENQVAHSTVTTGIAVLPFENLSRDREDSAFADGVQDDLLTKLAKIAGLKVISRTSVMQYRGKQNTHEIGKALHVSHVLEGSVRKEETWVHINVQLIDTHTDTHVWAEEYDRDLNEAFAIQSEIAQKVADQLHAKISAAEKLAIQRAPTADLTAFDLCSRAKNLMLETYLGSENKANLSRAAELLNQAVARDPSFFDAYCQLAFAHDAIYFGGYDHTPARLALAEAAIQTGFRLRPNAGEAHLARALNLYWGYLDYDGALAELEVIRQTQPNNPRVFEWTGTIQRRKGRWEESTRNMERALELDPRNTALLQQIALSYEYLRRYGDEELTLDRVLAIVPNDAATKAEHAVVELNWKADTRPLHQMIDSIQATDSAVMPKIADARLICALAERDVDRAKDALSAFGVNKPHLTTDNVPLTRLFLTGVVARMAKDEEKAQSAFAAARAEQGKVVQAQPNYGPALCVLGLIDAGLGQKEEALREGRRAVELLPVEKDAINGPAIMKYLAIMAAWLGDNDLACEQLAAVVRFPNSPTYGQLKLLPFWDPLRGDPRFEKIVASLAPK
jgi:TolB-like protein/Tfp pilus assembly protein PilF/predicted Ser/Thr protein kinase